MKKPSNRAARRGILKRIGELFAAQHSYSIARDNGNYDDADTHRAAFNIGRKALEAYLSCVLPDPKPKRSKR